MRSVSWYWRGRYEHSILRVRLRVSDCSGVGGAYVHAERAAMKNLWFILLMVICLTGCASSTTTSTPDARKTKPPIQHMVMLTWAAPTNGDTYVGYNIYRSPGTLTQWVKITPGPINQLDYDDLQVQSGHEYSYYVTSVDTSGAESGPSSIVTTVVPAP